MSERPRHGKLTRRAFLKRALQFALVSWPGAGLVKVFASSSGGRRSPTTRTGASLSPPLSARPSPAPLKVGAAVSRAGPLAIFGEATRRALVLWHEQFLAASDASDASNPPVLLEFVDDEGRPDVAADRFTRLAQRVHIAVGPYGSQLSAAILPICRETGLPVLLPNAGDPDLQLQGSAGAPPIGFSLLPPNTESLTGAVEWAASQGVRRVALLFRNDSFSQQVAQGVRRRAEELNLRIVWDRTYSTAAEIWQVAMELEVENSAGLGTHVSPDARNGSDARVDPDTSNGSSAKADPHTSNRAHAKVDSDAANCTGVPGGQVGLLLGGGYTPGDEAGGFLSDAREIAIAFEEKAVWKALLVAPTFPEFGRALGARAEGILGNTNWKSWFPWPGNAEFTAAYRRRWGEEPDNHAAAAYAAGQLIEAAWRRIQPGGDAATPARLEEVGAVRLVLRRALANLEMTTVFGPFAVDAHGRQTAHTNVLLQWRGGRLFPLNLGTSAQETTSL